MVLRHVEAATVVGASVVGRGLYVGRSVGFVVGEGRGRGRGLGFEPSASLPCHSSTKSRARALFILIRLQRDAVRLYVILQRACGEANIESLCACSWPALPALPTLNHCKLGRDLAGRRGGAWQADENTHQGTDDSWSFPEA